MPDGFAHLATEQSDPRYGLIDQLGAQEIAELVNTADATVAGAVKRELPAVAATVEAVVGPEIIAGSTRLKAGTATKMVLNMISPIAMVKLGRTYGNRRSSSRQ